MNEVLTKAEIEARFPREWVLLLDPQTDSNQQVLGGHVVCHSKNREEVRHRAMELPSPKHIAVFYTGPTSGKFLLSSFLFQPHDNRV
jgi:hypothetical protein